MAVLLKRSATPHIPAECIYGCCTTVYGKNVPKLRRTLKRADRASWKRELLKGEHSR